MPSATDERAFRVHARHLDTHHARLISASSFEAAAVAYIEDLHALGDEPEIRVIVREVASGHEHCFMVDVGASETPRR